MPWAALRAAATGLEAQQRNLEVIANNLANLQTPGYKSQRAVLADLRPSPEVLGAEGPARFQLALAEVGRGAGLAAVVANHAAGPLVSTARPLDVAIAGEGFLVVTLPDGRTAYTRDGALQRDGQGRLVTSSGALVTPQITVPPDATALHIDRDGRVLAQLPGGGQRELGRLQLARFPNPDGLERVGQNLLVPTGAAGAPAVGAPGEAGFGALLARQLEGANVQVADELVRLVQAQRAYSVGTHQLRALDEMLQEASDLRR
ncbi:MAG TPA: flagellar hook-basal body complex protein [Chloroflexota bacterium]|nr:flagellar hook-basal body complex protein [Chloroflexota bacterium]